MANIHLSRTFLQGKNKNTWQSKHAPRRQNFPHVPGLWRPSSKRQVSFTQGRPGPLFELKILHFQAPCNLPPTSSNTPREASLQPLVVCVLAQLSETQDSLHAQTWSWSAYFSTREDFWPPRSFKQQTIASFSQSCAKSVWDTGKLFSLFVTSSR